jgi:hypothetical protein
VFGTTYTGRYLVVVLADALDGRDDDKTIPVHKIRALIADAS